MVVPKVPEKKRLSVQPNNIFRFNNNKLNNKNKYNEKNILKLLG